MKGMKMLNGDMFIGGQARRGKGGTFHAIDASSGNNLPGEFAGATVEDVREAASLACEAFGS